MSGTFSYKLTTETELFTFDFSAILASTETISTASCTVQVKDGTDSNPNAIKVGSPAISGPLVVQRITGGLNGVIYRLEMTVTTSLTNVYTIVGDVAVYLPIEV
jgi:hypothetical protein